MAALKMHEEANSSGLTRIRNYAAVMWLAGPQTCTQSRINKEVSFLVFLKMLFSFRSPFFFFLPFVNRHIRPHCRRGSSEKTCDFPIISMRHQPLLKDRLWVRWWDSSGGVEVWIKFSFRHLLLRLKVICRWVIVVGCWNKNKNKTKTSLILSWVLEY